MLIDKAEIERVKRAGELVGFIRSRGVSLRQRGKQLVGLCPFHDDHEPSLVVDAKKQLWNCLGACHEGGDVYRFGTRASILRRILHPIWNVLTQGVHSSFGIHTDVLELGGGIERREGPQVQPQPREIVFRRRSDVQQ